MSNEQEGPTSDERASQLGWVNEETWIERGKDSEDHISAEDFMQKQEDNAGLAIKNNRRLSNQVHDQEKAIVRLEEKWQKLYDTDTTALKAKIRKAAEEGDMDAFDAHAASLDEREKEQTIPVNNEIQVAAQAFVDRIPEYSTDPAVKGAAIAIQDELKITISDPVELYAEVEKQLKQKLPGSFPQAQADVTPRKSVTPAGRPAPKNGKLTFNSLPGEDRAQFKTMQRMFKARGKEYTEKQFLKTYIESLSDA